MAHEAGRVSKTSLDLPIIMIHVEEHMKICEQAEMFIRKGDDFVFDHSKFILQDQSGNYFYSRKGIRLFPSVPIDVHELHTVPLKDIWPSFDPSMTRAPSPLAENHYVKRPSLLFYSDEQAHDLTNQIINEVSVCEILRSNPHPNIIEFLGCIVKDDKIQGLCFTKCSMDLEERLRDKKPLDPELYLRSLRGAILHLHALGLVHNDINPRNIMINENDVPIIIDFDSCKHEGELLDKSGTPDWCIEDAKYAMPENDFFSFALVEKYLLSKCTRV